VAGRAEQPPARGVAVRARARRQRQVHRTSPRLAAALLSLTIGRVNPEILTGATIRTMDPRRPIVEAVGIDSGVIAAAGSLAQVRATMGDGARIEDLGGGALLPGFIDAHHHLAYAALDYGGPSLRLPAGSRLDDLLAAITDAVAAKPPGWVYLCGYEVGDLRERRAPTADELEQCCPGRPLFVQAASGHDGALNQAGLDAMGWTASSRDPANGVIVRDRRGRPTGVVSEAATFMAEAAFRDQLLADGPEVWLAACEAHARDLLALGITRVGDAAVAPSVERLYIRAAQEERLPITVHAMPVASSSLLLPRFDGPATGEGVGRARTGPAKLFVDGGHRCAVCLSAGQAAWAAAALVKNVLGGRSLAAVRAASRSGRPKLGRDLHLHAGMRFWEKDALAGAIEHGAQRGFQIALHAIGNEAIDVALGALERNERWLATAPGRPRLEHVVFANPDQPARIAATGAIAVVQPAFIASAGDDMLLTPLPPSIATMPLRSLSEAGVELAGSSDYPVTQPDVLAAISAAVTRRTAAGATLAADQAMEVELMLHAYTLGAARALGCEQEAGSITEGKQADLVHLAEDPVTQDPLLLAEIDVKATWVAGGRA
jgi:predicted amidohydrolase YtcJ